MSEINSLFHYLKKLGKEKQNKSQISLKHPKEKKINDIESRKVIYKIK